MNFFAHEDFDPASEKRVMNDGGSLNYEKF